MCTDAKTFYVNPAAGSMTNPGTADLPWRTLEEVVNNRLIDARDLSGQSSANPVVKGGDTIVLMSGYHGDIRIKTGYHEKVVTIKAEKNHAPVIGSLKVDAGKNWLFSDLIINGSSSRVIQSIEYMVSIGTKETSHVTLANCYIYSTENAQTWRDEDWNTAAFHGISLGASAHHIHITNNYVTNVKLAINSNALDSVIAGNVVSFFAKDGIRVAANNNVVKDNIVTNNVLDDENHDDAIQGYSATGLQNIVLEGNIVLERTNEPNSFIKPLQGIGFFDGPNENIQVSGNVIKISGYHAISIYDSKNSSMLNNHVMGFNKNKARIAFGTKDKGGVKKNTVINNTSQAFLLDFDSELTEKDNKIVNLGDETAFLQHLKERLAHINAVYGEHHRLAGRTRLVLPTL